VTRVPLPSVACGAAKTGATVRLLLVAVLALAFATPAAATRPWTPTTVEKSVRPRYAASIRKWKLYVRVFECRITGKTTARCVATVDYKNLERIHVRLKAWRLPDGYITWKTYGNIYDCFLLTTNKRVVCR
jgi:hypothetical protein